MADQPDAKRKSRTDAVRTAVEQAFQATAEGASPVRERALEIADELASAATRFREALDELRPPSGDELRDLRDRLDALERRLDAVEAAAAPPAKPKPKPRGTGGKSGSTAKRAPAKPPAGKRSS